MQINAQSYLRLEKILFSKKTKVVFVVFVILLLLLIFTIRIYDLLIFIFLPLVAYFFIKQFIDRKNFMMKFAQDNGLDFEFSKTIDFPGRLFSLGNGTSTKTILNLIHGRYKEYPIKIFHYNYSVGSGKNRRTYHFTVCEVEISELDFPFILLKSNSMMKHASTDYFGQDKDSEINIGDEFQKVFTLYCRNEYEIEVLQIFNKELLSYLATQAHKFSIEFSKNKIYIYDDHIITTQQAMDEMYMVLKMIIDRSGELLKRLRDDFESMHEFYNKD